MRRVLSFLVIALLGSSALAINFFGDIGVRFAPSIQGEYLVADACSTLGFRGEIGEGFFPDAAYQAEIKGCYDAITGSGSASLGKTVMTVFLDDIDLHFGMQTVSWGSMNIFQPVDVVHAKDLTYPMGDPQAAKLPGLMAKMNYYGDGFQAEVFIMPVYRPMVNPSPVWPTPIPALGDAPAGGAYLFDPSEIASADLGAGSSLVESFVQVHTPELSLANTQFGVRVGIPVDVLDGADVNVSYYRGFRHEPHVSFTPVQLTPPVASVIEGMLDDLPISEAQKQQLRAVLGNSALHQSLYMPIPEVRFTPINLFGIDFSAVTGSWLLRGEAAFELSADSDGTDPGLGNNRFVAAIGAETILPGNAVLFGEVAYSHLFADAGEDNAVQSVETGLGGNYEISNRLTVQGAWIHNWTNGSGVLQPSLAYQLADGLHLNTNVAWLYGASSTTYGMWSDQSHVNIGITYSF